jgi:hypothetical protein
VTVFGSTRKSAATSPGVRRRSLLPSTDLPSHLRFGACLQCRENIRLLPCFPKNEPLVSLVSFGFGRAAPSAGSAAQACPPILPAVYGKWRDVPTLRVASRDVQRAITECARALLRARGIIGSWPITERVPGIRFTQSPVSGVTDGADALGTCRSGPPQRWLRVGWMSVSHRQRRCDRGPCRGDR